MPLGKLNFLHMLFLKNEVQKQLTLNNKINYATMLFVSKQVSLPKISSILQKMKTGPKSDTHPVCMKSFNYPNKVLLTK